MKHNVRVAVVDDGIANLQESRMKFYLDEFRFEVAQTAAVRKCCVTTTWRTFICSAKYQSHDFLTRACPSDVTCYLSRQCPVTQETAVASGQAVDSYQRAANHFATRYIVSQQPTALVLHSR